MPFLNMTLQEKLAGLQKLRKVAVVTCRELERKEERERERVKKRGKKREREKRVTEVERAAYRHRVHALYNSEHGQQLQSFQ